MTTRQIYFSLSCIIGNQLVLEDILVVAKCCPVGPQQTFLDFFGMKIRSIVFSSEVVNNEESIVMCFLRPIPISIMCYFCASPQKCQRSCAFVLKIVRKCIMYLQMAYSSNQRSLSEMTLTEQISYNNLTRIIYFSLSIWAPQNSGALEQTYGRQAWYGSE